MIDRNQTKSEDHEDNCFILFHAFATDDWTQASFWTQLQSQRFIFYPKAHSEYSPSLIPYAPWRGANLRIDVRNKQGAFSYMISLSTHLQQCMSISPGYSRILYMCPNLFSSVMQSAGRYIIHSRTIKNIYRGGKHHHLLSFLHIV